MKKRMMITIEESDYELVRKVAKVDKRLIGAFVGVAAREYGKQKGYIQDD
jgi:hypothetical protein